MAIDRPRIDRWASMGPLFFRAENHLLTRHRGHQPPASMGPLFFRAENRHMPEARTGKAGGFNGAALFQSGERACWAA